MSAPTLQQTNLVNTACKTAREGFLALSQLQTYLTGVTFSPSAAGVAAADWTDPATPGPLAGFHPSDFAAFNAAVAQVVALVQANNNAVGIAFQTLAERAPQV